MRSGRVRESAYEWPSSFHFVCDRLGAGSFGC
jgi:hypothetical protein